MRNSRFFVLILPFLALACNNATPTIEPSPAPATVTPIPAPDPTPTPVLEPPPIPIDLTEVGPITPTLPIKEVTVFGFTHQQSNGNRFVGGRGQMTTNQPVDIELSGEPRWIVAVPVDGGGSIWSAVMTDGNVQSFFILSGIVTPIQISPSQLPPGMPPLLVIHQGVPSLVTAPASDASQTTHPILVNGDPTKLAYIAVNGDLVIRESENWVRLEIDALPDARILQDEKGRLLVLSGSTDVYSHGVLGDRIEASSITLVETNPAKVAHVISTGNQVVEGIAPIWLDLNRDGSLEIIVTLADDQNGAQIVVFDELGSRLAEGPATGRGYRWRHQLAVAPFDEPGVMLLADNLTPHIGGITEFYEWDQETGLNIIASASGYSTHALGSRNLDMALAGDLDGNAIVELLVPSQSGDSLGAFVLQNGQLSLSWTQDLGAQISTNIAAVQTLDGLLGVGIGLSNDLLRLWLP